jgi:hypothetical protein
MKENTSMARKLPPNLGLKLAAVWLIATGVIGVANVSVAGLAVVMSVLAIIAGVLIIIER